MSDNELPPITTMLTEQFLRIAQLEADLLRAASERDEAKIELAMANDEMRWLYTEANGWRARVQRLTDELAWANMLFSLSSLRQQAEALPRMSTIPGGTGQYLIERGDGNLLFRDAVLQLLTPQTHVAPSVERAAPHNLSDLP